MEESSLSTSTNNRRKLIINGHNATRFRYPYFTSLHHSCGGALIAPDTVLTAGHCLPHHKYSVQPHVGRYTFYEHLKDDQTIEETFDIVAMERHPRWKLLGDDEFRYDVALLYLNDTAHNKPYLKLNRNDSLPFAGEELMAMGMGLTTPDWEHGHSAMILQEVRLHYLPNDQCMLATNAADDNNNDDDRYDDDDTIYYEGRIHPDHLCTTGGPNNTKDACAFDSGSPIIIAGNRPEEDILVALVSWGEGCADPDFPAVNTRITESLDFITESVCRYSMAPPPEFRCPGTETEAPTQAPTELPPPPPLPLLSTSQMWGIMIAVIVATLCIIKARANKQQAHNKYGLGKQYSTSSDEETQCLYQDSPASSKASSTTSGSGASSNYNAIEMNV